MPSRPSRARDFERSGGGRRIHHQVYNMPRRYTMREHAVVMAHATALTELRRIASTRQRDFDDVARCHLWVSILCAALDARCND